MKDLFEHHGEQVRRGIAPLADRLRPRSLEEFVGQEAILGRGRLLRRAIAADRVGNLILHGPPGTGKTTLARIIANTTRAHFSTINAVLAGVREIRAEVEGARQRLERHGRRTILFIDEVHRFSSAQQDALLPWVENGTLTLIGATTENPFFEVSKALVSRSRLFRLQPLEPADLERLLQRALRDPDRGYGDRDVELSGEASAHLVRVAAGDARSLLNALELAVETTPPDGSGRIRIDLAIAEESIQERAVLYDKQGDAHFDTISAFIKSLRGSDPDAALFWLARMVEAGENPRFIFRRMLIAAGEDIGLADPQAMVVVEACAAAFDRVGLPEGLYPLAHATLYLAGTEKSNSALGFFDALKSVRSTYRQEVPAHLRDAHRDRSAFGDGVGYRYPHAYAEHWVAQQYLPDSLQGQMFWRPGRFGWEGELQARLQQRRAAQLAAAAELALDQPELLSSGPDDPALERWVKRQAVAEGERLDRLRRRFWQDASLGRLDRVLILEAHSLLWALDPLLSASEGEVVISPADDSAAERIRAQLEVLDQLRRPRLLAESEPPSAPLAHLLLQEGAARFEWIAARQPFGSLDAAALERELDHLTSLAAPGAQLRFLFSHPRLGPAGLLLLQQQQPSGRSSGHRDEDPERSASADLLREAARQERRWIDSSGQDGAGSLAGGLERRGWQIAWQRWEEPMAMSLNERLLRRWCAPGASFRGRLEEHLGAEDARRLVHLFHRELGGSLHQTLEHSLVLAQRSPAICSTDDAAEGRSAGEAEQKKAPVGDGGR